MATPMTPAALKRLKVAEVRETLQQQGLDASGTKDVMLHRYEAFFNTHANAPAETPSKPSKATEAVEATPDAGGRRSTRQRSTSVQPAPAAAASTRKQSVAPKDASEKTLLEELDESTVQATPARRRQTKSPSPVKAMAEEVSAKSTKRSREEETPHAPKKRKEESIAEVEEEEEEEEEEEAMPKSKGASKRKKKNKKKAKRDRAQENSRLPPQQAIPEDIEIEYVDEQLDPSLFGAMGDVFAKFAQHAGLAPTEEEAQHETEAPKEEDEMQVDNSDASDDDGEENEALEESKRKLKTKRMTVAQLKQHVPRPKLVEWFDVAASDPFMLMEMKSTKNAVPVPRHWSLKRKYLANKRGIEKPPFELPDFIKATGIMQVRNTSKEKDDEKSLAAKSRAKLNPKMGKIDLDYQKLHDAFFRFQKKPRMSAHGEIYYEGKEYETKLKVHRPGVLSNELKQALAIPPMTPPPWLINMQRYGPPPSYKGLKIPGLNCPIPPGAQWGYHPGGWGRPPVDEHGQPLYGDVFARYDARVYAPPVSADRSLWGELEVQIEFDPPAEGEEAQETGEGEEAAAGEEQADIEMEDGTESPSGITSTATTVQGLQTPDAIQLRKTAAKEPPKELFRVLEQSTKQIDSAFMGSQHGYTVSIDPDQMVKSHNLQDAAATTYQHHQQQQEQASAYHQKGREDFSEMVQDHAQKQAAKHASKAEAAKKKKDFKF